MRKKHIFLVLKNKQMTKIQENALLLTKQLYILVQAAKAHIVVAARQVNTFIKYRYKLNKVNNSVFISSLSKTE